MMDVIPRNPNEETDEGRRLQVVTSPSLSHANVAFVDVSDTDDEGDGDGDDDFDSSDEEVTNNDEAGRDLVHDGTEASLAADTTSNSLNANLSYSTTEAVNGTDKDVDRLPVNSGDERGSQKGNVAQENKFLAAMMHALTSYSTRIRVPYSTSPALKTPQMRHTLPRSLYLHDLESDESDGSDCEIGFSSDRFDDEEALPNRPTLDAGQAAQLFYHPSNSWAEFANAPIENPMVIATLHEGAMCEAYIKQGLLDGRKITYISKTWRLSQKWEGFFSEMALYSDPAYLRQLQGSVVPQIIGLYLVEGATSVAMELPSSEFWIEASEDMSNHLKRKCIAAFDAIHDRGVLHNDVELRHMLISSQGDVTIIDFQESRALKPVKAVGLKLATDAEICLEKRKVRFKLNYGDAKARETEKRRRVLRRDELKRQTRISRLKLVALGQSIDPPGPDEESEPEDADNVFNPIVDPQTWENCWIGEPSTPTCCIVPGQDKFKVHATFQEFMMEELDRQEKDKITNTDDHMAPNISEETGPSGDKDSLPIPNPANTPVLPTRINLKRGRDLAGDTLDEVPSPKKRLLSHASADVGDFKSDTQSDADSSAVVATLPVNSPTEPTGRVTLSTVSPTNKRPLVAEIYVPFEGYTGSDGFILPNLYSPEELSRMRRNWIQQYNIQRCIDDNLPYPLAELENKVPSTIVKIVEVGQNGKKTRRKLIRNRGTMRRAQLEMENPGKRKRDAAIRMDQYFGRRKETGTGVSDTEDGSGNEPNSDAGNDGVAEGPRIMSWQELQELQLAGHPHSSAYSTASPLTSPLRFGPKQTQPSRGVLRRQLTPQEKARNCAHLELYKKRNPPDPDDEDDKDSDFSRPAKRARIDSSPSGMQSESLSGGGIGFERYSAGPNAFAARSGSSDGGSSIGSRLLSAFSSRLTSSVVRPSVPCPSPSDIIPRRVNRNVSSGGTSSGGDQFSARATVSSSRFSDNASESSSPDGNDQEPSSSAWPPRRTRRWRRPEGDANVGFRNSWYYEVPVEGLPPPAPLTEEDVVDMAEVEESIVVDNGTRWPWANFTFSFPWRWPTF